MPATPPSGFAASRPLRIAGHQPNYLPYPGFFHKLLRADAYVLVDNVQFVKRGSFGWIHRNRVRTAQAPGWCWLTVPVQTAGRYTQSIAQTVIDNRGPWRRKHWRTLELNYARAPHWARYRDELREIYDTEWTMLAALNETLIRLCLRALALDLPVHRSSDLGATGQATELILDFCARLGATTYISGTHGRDYLDQPRFAERGIELVFQDFACPVYPQVQGGPFLPNLSILDLLFNLGPETRRILEAV